MSSSTQATKDDQSKLKYPNDTRYRMPIHEHSDLEIPKSTVCLVFHLYVVTDVDTSVSHDPL